MFSMERMEEERMEEERMEEERMEEERTVRASGVDGSARRFSTRY